MDDKWFVFERDGVVRFCRSWTGVCVFRLVLHDDGENDLYVEPGYHSKSGGPEEWFGIIDALLSRTGDVTVPVNLVPAGITGNIRLGWPDSRYRTTVCGNGDIEIALQNPPGIRAGLIDAPCRGRA